MKAESGRQKAIVCPLPRSRPVWNLCVQALSTQLTADTLIRRQRRTSNYFLSSYMKTKECPSCAMEVDIESDVCPICKYQFTRQSSSLKWAALLLAILFLIYLLFF